jgi:hypothetical protein
MDNTPYTTEIYDDGFVSEISRFVELNTSEILKNRVVSLAIYANN